jgi:hypothetical protein
MTKRLGSMIGPSFSGSKSLDDVLILDALAEWNYGGKRRREIRDNSEVCIDGACGNGLELS